MREFSRPDPCFPPPPHRNRPGTGERSAERRSPAARHVGEVAPWIGSGEGGIWPDSSQARLAAAAAAPLTPESLMIVRQICRRTDSASGESGLPLVSAIAQSASSPACSSAVSSVCARTWAWQPATAAATVGSGVVVAGVVEVAVVEVAVVDVAVPVIVVVEGVDEPAVPVVVVCVAVCVAAVVLVCVALDVVCVCVAVVRRLATVRCRRCVVAWVVVCAVVWVVAVVVVADVVVVVACVAADVAVDVATVVVVVVEGVDAREVLVDVVAAAVLEAVAVSCATVAAPPPPQAASSAAHASIAASAGVRALRPIGNTLTGLGPLPRSPVCAARAAALKPDPSTRR